MPARERVLTLSDHLRCGAAVGGAADAASAGGSASAAGRGGSADVAALHAVRLFRDYELTDEMKHRLGEDGHLVIPGLLTDEAVDRLIASLSRVQTLHNTRAGAAELEALQRGAQARGVSRGGAALDTYRRELRALYARFPGLRELSPGQTAMEHDTFLEAVIGHPQMLALARGVLGPDVRFDHMVALNRPGAAPEMAYHAHEYADGKHKFPRRRQPGAAVPAKVGQLADSDYSVDDPRLGFIRIFFYATGFERGNGNLKVVPGSHLFRDPTVQARDDAALRGGWMRGKRHPVTGRALEIERLECPRGSVVVMWTHAVHGVEARRALSPTRWSVVTAYRNPGAPSISRWITDRFARKPVPGLADPRLGAAGLKDHTY